MPMDVKVGDEVIVVEGRRSVGDKRRAMVTKVARVYFTVTYAGSSRTDQFHLDNGRLKGNDIGWGVYAKTPEQIDQEERRVAAKEALRARGVEFRLGFHAAYTVEQLEALVALVETFDESKED